MHTFPTSQTRFTRRMIFNKSLDIIEIFNKSLSDHQHVNEILRNLPPETLVGKWKETALQAVGYRIWLESTEYDYFNEHMEDVKIEVVHDIEAMEYKVMVVASIPEDVYAYYTFVEK